MTSGMGLGSMPKAYSAPSAFEPAHGMARRTLRSSAAGSQNASTYGTLGISAGPFDPRAGPSSAWSAAGASSSSSVVRMSPQYWISDRVPVITEHAITSYIIPERDPTHYATLPEDIDQVCFLVYH